MTLFEQVLEECDLDPREVECVPGGAQIGDTFLTTDIHGKYCVYPSDDFVDDPYNPAVMRFDNLSEAVAFMLEA